MVNDKVSTGETVSAVIKNAKTGEKRVIEKPSKYKIEITITDLRTGEITKYEAKR